MNIGSIWDQLVCSVCRPPRDVYEESELIGGTRCQFRFGETPELIRKYYRQDVVLTNPRGLKLQCSHFRPCVPPTVDGRLPCVVYCHTNSGSRRDCEEILFNLLPKGITVFALDFSGSGISEGDWVTLGCREVEDLEVAVQYLREEGSTTTLALWGRSMGAVTALLYARRDPSVAGIVLDSGFSKLIDLMLELGTDQSSGLNIPRPLVRVALAVMRRSVRKRAGFDIDDVAPVDVAHEVFVPALFGHAEGDTFVAPHHSQRLYDAYGGDSKNFIKFEGDHNSMRSDFWYDSAMIFLLGALQVDPLDFTLPPSAAVAQNGQQQGGLPRHTSSSINQEAGDDDDDEVESIDPQQRLSRFASSQMPETTAGLSVDDDDAELQRALELSLQETSGNTSSSNHNATTETTESPRRNGENDAVTATVGHKPEPQQQISESKAAGGAVVSSSEIPRSLEDEEAMLARAIQESLNLTENNSSSSADASTIPTVAHTDMKTHQAQRTAAEHASQEAAAVRMVSTELHDALLAAGASGDETGGAALMANHASDIAHTIQQEVLDGGEEKEEEDPEEALQRLRNATSSFAAGKSN